MATSLFSSLSAPTTEFSDPTAANQPPPGSTSSISSSSTRQRGEDNTMKPLCRAYRPPLCSAPNQLSGGSLSSTSFPSTAIFNDMAKTSPTEENPSPLAKSDEEEEKSRSDDSKLESCSSRSSLLVSIFQLKPVTKFTGRKSGVAVLSPKVSHFTKQAVGSESLRQRMRTEHNERYFTVKRKYPEEEGEFLETETTENNIVGLEQETELHSSITVCQMEAFQAVFEQISCEHVFVIGRSEQNVKIGSLEEAIRGSNVSLLWFGTGNSIMRQETHFSC